MQRIILAIIAILALLEINNCEAFDVEIEVEEDPDD